VYRGELRTVSHGWLSLLRHNGREVLIPAAAVRAVLDEQRFVAGVEHDFPLRCHAGAGDHGATEDRGEGDEGGES
jgi:hypothetical protein